MISDRVRSVQRVLFIEGAANLAVLAVKLWVGLQTGSLAILGDSLHSATDLANNVASYFAVRISGTPPDANHPYGHRKFETLAVFLLATLLTVTAFELGLRALLHSGGSPVGGALELGLMLGVLVVNTVVSLWQRARARALDSELLLADAQHTAGDVLISVAIIAGWQLSSRGFGWLDPVLAFAVAGLIFWLAFGLFRRAIPVLVDEGAIDPERLQRVVATVPGVVEVRRVRSRWIGSCRAVDLVLAVPAAYSTVQGHVIADRVEDLLEREFGVSDASVHLEPA